MWFTRKTPQPLLVLADDTFACTGTLVLHADGTDECEHSHLCEADELAHADVVSCDEIGCACAGETAPAPFHLPALVLAA